MAQLQVQRIALHGHRTNTLPLRVQGLLRDAPIAARPDLFRAVQLNVQFGIHDRIAGPVEDHNLQLHRIANHLKRGIFGGGYALFFSLLGRNLDDIAGIQHVGVSLALDRGVLPVIPNCFPRQESRIRGNAGDVVTLHHLISTRRNLWRTFEQSHRRTIRETARLRPLPSIQVRKPYSARTRVDPILPKRSFIRKGTLLNGPIGQRHLNRQTLYRMFVLV
jgi:hypothetical protein